MTDGITGSSPRSPRSFTVELMDPEWDPSTGSYTLIFRITPGSTTEPVERREHRDVEHVDNVDDDGEVGPDVLPNDEGRGELASDVDPRDVRIETEKERVEWIG